ncbi:MAG: phosphodiesterase [Clostridia bacterium]|nr:phosphodiesterase [Clostridia bacterium]
MKWMIASDIHGSAQYCRELLEAFDREQADRLLLLGDLLYHGPRNDLPDGYAPKEVISLLNARKDVIFCVRGNCEAEVDQMVLDFPVLADYMLLEEGGRMIYATHGHHFGEQNPPPFAKGSLLLNGHTHVPACNDHGDWVYLNPGSVSIPKENSPRGYMTLEKGTFLWKTLKGEGWKSYQI